MSGPELINPPCYNRKPLATSHPVQKGWLTHGVDARDVFDIWHKVIIQVPNMVDQPYTNTRGCATYHNGETGRHRYNCKGCRWTALALDCTLEQEAWQSAWLRLPETALL